MIDWSDPAHVGSVIGVVGGSLGALAGVWGACLGVFAPKGLHRGAIISSGYLLLGVSIAGLVTGIVLLVNGRVMGIWLPTILVGANMAIMSAIFIRVAKKRYDMAEERFLSAESLRRE